MDIHNSLKEKLEENDALAIKADKMRSRRSWLPRLLKNWLRNSDGEAECHAQMLGNQNQMIDIIRSELSRLAHQPPLQPDARSRLFSDLYIVHSMPKVGGMSIAATLAANFKDAEVIHVHLLSENGIRLWWTALPDAKQQQLRDSVLMHIYNARKAAMMIEAGQLLFPNTQKRTIVCGVREPISYALSNYFHSYENLSGRTCNEITVDMAANFVVGTLKNQLDYLGPLLTSPERWLVEEFNEAHNFDIFSHAFDTGKGYQIYDMEKFKILVIRQENLSSLPVALSSIIGCPAGSIAPVNENIGESKAYSGIYRSIKEKLRFDIAFLDTVYSDAYCRKFYSDVERESFKRRWLS